jgi:hypothetical protein
MGMGMGSMGMGGMGMGGIGSLGMGRGGMGRGGMGMGGGMRPLRLSLSPPNSTANGGYNSGLAAALATPAPRPFRSRVRVQ